MRLGSIALEFIPTLLGGEIIQIDQQASLGVLLDLLAMDRIAAGGLPAATRDHTT